ncbi:hypothetical protein FRZ67_11795 [Panacibacter ginsenosidivorans]|uniref:PNPLA domain-containing protein n=1 Tax=Panacibacter ginsenosidivorans TaxID=1813871 RepID=A0A5B8V8T3_9BACT|nr:hypothetical protein [Panacibacter ginsenosidivorans]QEC67950.1 hypothetical protein FRZ67_11795 [Panacibacter ginsenosidivorans]
MKKYLVGFLYSLPVQLLLLHFRRYHILLIFWYILFATVSGNFLEPYGANSLYLAPEYLTQVSALSTMLVGFAIGIFIMSWNITTFILHTKQIRFLATTEQPFLKFCVNNAVIPVTFLVFYFFNAISYDANEELLDVWEILALIGGFLGGFILALIISFAYFFGADINIYKRFGTHIIAANRRYEKAAKTKTLTGNGKTDIRVDWFLSAKFGLRKPRNVQHYSEEFLDTIFKRHHFAAVIAILISFIFLLTVGFFSDNKIFQVPAAASITVFFAILIAVAGAVSLFLRSWSMPVILIIYVLLNWMYQQNIIDPRNKAYGLNYDNKNERPSYSRDSILQLVAPENLEKDKQVFLTMLNNWKRKQNADKPVMFIINTSGGGTRSATFTLNVLQRLDSVTGGQLMPHTFLINGASGGMLGATYFRELYWEKLKGNIKSLDSNAYSKNIARDLLNPLFSSFISRDLVGPVRKFEVNDYTYTRDRGYAFEQKLNDNTKGILDKKLIDYKQAEEDATIPVAFFNSMITRDARELVISTHPARFLMQPFNDSVNAPLLDPDAIDYTSFFYRQNPLNLRILSAMRMNATFPYVLPNVILPTDPVVDVMDAGLRDNFGQQTSLRFINYFKDWLKQNTSKVVLIQIRDRQLGDWERPYEPTSMLSFVTKPFLLLQNNWYRLQDYYQADQLNYLSQAFGQQFQKVSFQYDPLAINSTAALSFHLTATEKIDLEAAMESKSNQSSFQEIIELIK